MMITVIYDGEIKRNSPAFETRLVGEMKLRIVDIR